MPDSQKSDTGSKHLDFWGLAISVAGIGCLATGAQMYMVRDFFTLFAGDELSLAVVFACWLAGTSAGTAAGGLLARSISHPWRWFALAGLSSSVLFPILISLLRWIGELSSIEAVGALPSAGTLLLTGLVYVFPFSFLMGFTFPMACQVAASQSARTLAVGRAYVLESIGAVAGGVAVGIVLPGILSTMAAMMVLSFPLLVGIALVYRTRHKVGYWAAVSLACGLLVLITSGFASHLDDITTAWRFDRLKAGKRIAWADTAYQHLDLSEASGQYNLFAQDKITSSFPDPYRVKPRTHLVLSQHPNPRDVLLLGPSYAGFAPAALHHPIKRLDMVELDPGVVALVRPFLPESDSLAMADSRVHLHLTDGRRYMNQSTAHWDLVFSDSPDPATASLNRFYTKEFFSLARRHLKPGGVFCTRVSSVVNLQGMETGDRLRTIQLTMASVFKHVFVIPGQETFICAAEEDGRILDDPKILAARMRALHIDDPGFSPEQFQMLVQTEFVKDLAKRLEAMGPRPINTDDHPITYLQSVAAWSEMTRDPAGKLIKTAMNLPWWSWFAITMSFVLLSGIPMAFRSSAPRQGILIVSASVSVAVVGATGMALELILSYAYQSLAGSLYRELGLIVASFMAGLVSGGAVTQRLLSRRQSTPLSLAISLLVFGAFSAVLPSLLHAQMLDSLPLLLAQIWIFLLVFSAGAFTGVIFPLAARLALFPGGTPGVTGGRLDAWDHAGASLSALFAGLIMLPMLGRSKTCFLLASLCVLAAGITLLVSKKSQAGKSQ